jgi:hypothetical protein
MDLSDLLHIALIYRKGKKLGWFQSHLDDAEKKKHCP